MQKILLTLFVSSLALLMGSCQSSISEKPQSAPKETSLKTPETGSKTEEAQETKESNAQIEELKSDIKVPGLISPTNPDRRRQSISEGRKDPFSVIPLIPTVQGERRITVKGGTPTVQQPGTPFLAQDVVVTGVVKIGSVTQAIVKAPNERFSRHVRAGQYLSNGLVLVKRIDTKSTPPIVVLEQSGREVSKRVGQGAS